MISSVLLIIASSFALARCVSVPIKPGNYCATVFISHDVFGDSYSCIIFDYESESKARMTYNFIDSNILSMKYNNVSMRGDEVILKRSNHTEGPELFPYFKVGFALNVTKDGLRMFTKDGNKTYNLSATGCTIPSGGNGNCGPPPSPPPPSAERQNRRSIAPHNADLSDKKRPDGPYADDPEPDHFQTNFWISKSANSTMVMIYDSTKYQEIWSSTGLVSYVLSPTSSDTITIYPGNKDKNLRSSLWDIDALYIYHVGKDEVHFSPNNHSNPDRVLVHRS